MKKKVIEFIVERVTALLIFLTGAFLANTEKLYMKNTNKEKKPNKRVYRAVNGCGNPNCDCQTIIREVETIEEAVDMLVKEYGIEQTPQLTELIQWFEGVPGPVKHLHRDDESMIWTATISFNYRKRNGYITSTEINFEDVSMEKALEAIKTEYNFLMS